MVSEPQALVEEHAVSESERGCSGYGTFPRGGVCYSGAFLVESLHVRVVTQGAHHGYVNMKVARLGWAGSAYSCCACLVQLLLWVCRMPHH